MKQAPEEDLPDLLRKRVLRQRKRLKIVRFTFALTVVSSVILLFLANQSQTLVPNERVTYFIPVEGSTWLLDQQLDLTAENVEPTGSFTIVRLDGDAVTKGTQYDGLVRSVTPLDSGQLGVTTASRFMVFDISGDEWQRTEMRSLGLNDPTASPAVVWFKETLWLCWVSASDIMVRPFDRPEVEAKSLHKTHSAGASLRVHLTNDAIWLSIFEPRGGDLTLVSFTPGVEQVLTPDGEKPAEDTDADELPADDPIRYRTTVQRHFSSEVTSNLRGMSFAVVSTPQGPRPVVAISRKDDSNRKWHLLVWTKDESSQGKWVDADPPPRAKPPTGMEITNFMSLASSDQEIMAVYSEGTIKLSRTALAADESLEWSEPTEVPLDETIGPTAYIIWVTVLFGLLLVMASQGVWLLLNRERGLDRTLAEIIDNQKKETTGKDKDAPKLLYANAMGRALALMLDLAVTSPVVILLQGIYGYSWEQAYGFLAIGSVSALDASLLPALAATAVTLLVLSIYGMVCELVWGRTFGKALLKLRVVDAEGEQPSSWRIVVRNVFKVVELIHWIVVLVPMGLMMMSGKQQRLGDLLAGTFVIVDVVADEAPDDIDI